MAASRAILVVFLLLIGVTSAIADQPAPPSEALPSSGPARETLDRLLAARSWARRAVAAVRLERYDDQESQELLVGMLEDPAWQVRAFAVRTLGRRRVPARPSWFEQEADPRVLRAALRHRYPFDSQRLARGVNYLVGRRSLHEKMLGVELAATSGDTELAELADETLRSIILRMNRRQAGSLAPRLATLTEQPSLRRRSAWQRWLRRAGRPLPMVGGWAVPEDPGIRPERSLIAQLDEERFFNLEDYITKLAERRVDLVICLDTTASMGGELAEAQSELDEMMLFAGDVVRELRVGLVAYRDRRDRDYETRGWDLTADVATARSRLWQLAAGGGGDTPEAVYPALRVAYGQMSWVPEHTKVLVLIGDAPPHAGFGGKSVTLAAEANRQLDLVTHAVQAEGKDVKYFGEIAEAGSGRCVNLDDRGSLVVEIAGLTLGDRFADEFRDFFATYMQLCR